MSTAQTVDEVVGQHLCAGCGTCAGICPVGAIRMSETAGGLLRPRIDVQRCTLCGLCRRVCPGGLLDPSPGGGHRTAECSRPVIAAWRGWATDERIREAGQSGGLVTALLLHLLHSGVAQAVSTVGIPADGSLRPQAALTDDAKVVCKAQGSKYAPVAANLVLGNVLRQGRRVALVGLPCHVEGLRLAARVFPALDTRVSLSVGLLCGGTLSALATERLARLSPYERSLVRHVVYKRKSSGDLLVTGSGGACARIARHNQETCKYFYTPARCRLCWDKLNADADLAVGDPWGVVHDPRGESVVLVRTARGAECLDAARRADAVHLELLDPGLIYAGQGVARHLGEQSRCRRMWSGGDLTLSKEQARLRPLDALLRFPAPSLKAQMVNALSLESEQSVAALERRARRYFAWRGRLPRWGLRQRLRRLLRRPR
jgi:coenzyme F420 hydrogenase subunit beta